MLPVGIQLKRTAYQLWSSAIKIKLLVQEIYQGPNSYVRYRKYLASSRAGTGTGLGTGRGFGIWTGRGIKPDWDKDLSEDPDRIWDGDGERDSTRYWDGAAESDGAPGRPSLSPGRRCPGALCRHLPPSAGRRARAGAGRPDAFSLLSAESKTRVGNNIFGVVKSGAADTVCKILLHSFPTHDKGDSYMLPGVHRLLGEE